MYPQSKIIDLNPDRQVILLLTISQSLSLSWPRAPNCDSWPYFSSEENFGIVFRGTSTLRGWTGLPRTGVTVFVYVMCIFMCVCLSRFDIIIIIIYNVICTC